MCVIPAVKLPSRTRTGSQPRYVTTLPTVPYRPPQACYFFAEAGSPLARAVWLTLAGTLMAHMPHPSPFRTPAHPAAARRFPLAAHTPRDSPPARHSTRLPPDHRPLVLRAAPLRQTRCRPRRSSVLRRAAPSPSPASHASHPLDAGSHTWLMSSSPRHRSLAPPASNATRLLAILVVVAH